MEQFHYPNDINKPEFAHRRISFIACTGECVLGRSDLVHDLTSSVMFNAGVTTAVGVASGGLAAAGTGVAIAALGENSTAEARCMITLPLPGSLSDDQTHTWKSESITNAVKQGFGDISSVISMGSNTKLTKLLKAAKKGVDFAKKIGPALANQTRSRMPSLNPGYFQNYDNSSLRSFSFSFKFIPENREEAKTIVDIVSRFKAYSSPSKFSGVMLLSPFTWLIVVSNDKINELMQISNCVCTSVKVTYGTDKMDCFDDGMPKEIALDLGFSECSLQYSDNYGLAYDGTETLRPDTQEEMRNIENAFEKIGQYEAAKGTPE